MIMFLLKPLAFSLFAASALAYTLPANLPNGVYTVTLNEQGEQVLRRLGEVDLGHAGTLSTKRTAEDMALVDERQIDGGGGGEDHQLQFRCGCGINMNHGNCDAAVQGLKNYIGDGKFEINPHQYSFSYYNDVVAFLCSYDEETRPRADDLGTIFSQIAGKCGYFVPGTQRWSPGTSAIDIGYTNYHSGLDFCGAGWNSSAASRC